MSSTVRILLTLLLAVTCLICSRASSQTFTALASFDTTDGTLPATPLVQAVNGNFYGTTPLGGQHGMGVVFEVTPSGTLTLVYSFCSRSNCSDGFDPNAALVVGANGNLYGTTTAGGAYCPGDLNLGCGTVFEITPAGKLTTLYKFCAVRSSCTDGAYPEARLLLGSDGNFYGTTYQGGANGSGTVFKITPTGKLTTLYSFCSLSNCADGEYPITGVVESNGKFYGTTYDGGTALCPFFNNTFGCGTIFSITSQGAMTTLYNFGTDAGLLQAPLAVGKNGKLYGTSADGGTGNCNYGCGTVFDITPTGAFTTLYSFCTKGTNYCPDGAYPIADVVQATDGNLYGTTETGGDGGGGTIFNVTSQGAVATLYSLTPSDGYMSEGGLLQATDGNLYGTTNGGGTTNQGTVFRFSMGLAPFVEPVPTGGRVGARVLILGNNLTGTTSVSFNGTSAQFSVVSNTELTTTVPTGATSGTISVVTPSGTLGSNVKFRVIP